MRIKCGLDNAASIIFLFITYKIGNTVVLNTVLFYGMTRHNFGSDDDCCCSKWLNFIFSMFVHKCGSGLNILYLDVRIFGCSNVYPTLWTSQQYYHRTFKHHYFILFCFVSFRFLFDWYLKWFDKSRDWNPEL